MFYCTLMLVSVCVLQRIECFEDTPNVFLTAPKSVPRLGRSNKDNADFEKFFLKASKSVPRIGRRNENPFLHFDDTQKEYTETSYLKYPAWSELADKYEHNPELFSNPHLLFELDKAMGDDPTAYDWNSNVRMKRKTPGKKI